jgi:tetratricopeptide (TPR) repeat protein
MATSPAVSECLNAFMRRDYENCSAKASDMLMASFMEETAPDFDALLLCLISFERLGNFDYALKMAKEFYNRLPDEWHQQLMALSIGRGEPDKLLDMVGDKRDEAAAVKMWQIDFCLAAQYVSRHRWDKAREILQSALTSGVTPVSCMAMVLCVIEYNYIYHGSALSEFDKPIVELNVKASETEDMKTALEIAHRAYDEANLALGRQHPARSTATFNLAAIYLKSGRFAEAEPYLKESVALYKEACGANDPNVIDKLNTLGALYKRLGKDDLAGECYAEALELSENSDSGGNSSQ